MYHYDIATRLKIYKYCTFSSAELESNAPFIHECMDKLATNWHYNLKKHYNISELNLKEIFTPDMIFKFNWTDDIMTYFDNNPTHQHFGYIRNYVKRMFHSNMKKTYQRGLHVYEQIFF